MSDDPYKVVLRFAAFFPGVLSRIEMHALRSGGDLDHVDLGLTSRNRAHVGATFAAPIRTEIKGMMRQNRAEEVTALRKARQKTLADQREEDGFLRPYKESANGPLREIVLTANKAYFAAPPDAPEEDVLITYSRDKDGHPIENRLCKAKIAAFEQRGLEFFKTYFPDSVRHLRLDLDEEAPHFHAIIMPVVEKTSKRRGRQLMIEPGSNPLIRDYEHAQDVAGEFFGCLGLVRGERRAEQRREALEADLPLPDVLKSKAPRDWRAERAKKLLDRETQADQRTAEADQKIAHADLAAALARDEREEARRRQQLAEERQKEAEQAIGAAQTHAATARASKEAVMVGLDAILKQELTYLPATDQRRDGLTFGPAAPESRTTRDRLIDRIRPASRWLTDIAAWVARLLQREKDLHRQEAEITRRAAILAKAEAAQGRSVPGDIAEIAASRMPVTYTASSFPDAWHIGPNADKVHVQRQLDAMENKALSACHRATRDALLLCEEPSELRTGFSRGLGALEVGANQRGYDLATGKHDPHRAADPGRALLHTDQEALPIRVWRQGAEELGAR
ncbi:hypothetical protein [Rubellimicrobium aerolatum]|uniref:Plasmid recombination enzyme n=1 Tax=Rubellimicrobium aerolatum TaxID=490979 RepID=A0ABW0S8P9_9RHOB|nr:hypothetical protein [Rubellimicrobium aerolatum]MBP1804685.1 hypothetical protein [Rubellimicrobium aerolatum]